MNNADKITDAAVVAMTDITTSLKTMAPEVWAAAVRQQIVQGSIGLAVAALLLAAVAGLAVPSFKALRQADEAFIPLSLLEAILLIVSVVTVTCCLPLVLNPQWGAIQDIANLLKK